MEAEHDGQEPQCEDEGAACEEEGAEHDGLEPSLGALNPDRHRSQTGHDNGLITLALREADDAVREKVRGEMGEPYRTLLGHFRHESGHYFWDRLVSDDAVALDAFRGLFGDERADYAAALQEHYAHGAPANWQEHFVSVYATTHPWEDFAETWAHYLHIADTLETAAAFGLRVKPEAAGGDLAAKVTFDPHNAADIDQLIDAWLPIAFAVNSLNRSMGHADFYPFVLTPATIEKLNFVHQLIHRVPFTAASGHRDLQS